MVDEPQQAVNQQEWDDPANWGGRGRLLVTYFSTRDVRLWVPQRIPSLGWTVNLGHPWGTRLLAGGFATIVLWLGVVLVIMAWVCR